MKISNTNVTINVGDLDSSISFYTSIGFSVQARWGNHYAQLNAPGIQIGLHPSAQSGQNSGNVSIGFTTDDFAKTRTELSQLGIKVNERAEEGGNFLHFEDPDGTSLYFIQPKW